MPNLEDDVFRIAEFMYRQAYTGTRTIVVSHLRKEVSLPPERFDRAEDYLLEAQLIDGTIGGEEGEQRLTPLGIHFVNSRLRDAKAKKRWSRGDVIAVISLVLVILAIVAAFIVPEVRGIVGLKP